MIKNLCNTYGDIIQQILYILSIGAGLFLFVSFTGVTFVLEDGYLYGDSSGTSGFITLLGSFSLTVPHFAYFLVPLFLRYQKWYRLIPLFLFNALLIGVLAVMGIVLHGMISNSVIIIFSLIFYTGSLLCFFLWLTNKVTLRLSTVLGISIFGCILYFCLASLFGGFISIGTWGGMPGIRYYTFFFWHIFMVILTAIIIALRNPAPGDTIKV